jgi:hypothetical protein
LAQQAQVTQVNTAIVPIVPELRENPTGLADRRARADFVTHLLATAARVPQTRDRRRAEPEEAVAAYRALHQWPSEPGRTLSRAL